MFLIHQLSSVRYIKHKNGNGSEQEGKILMSINILILTRTFVRFMLACMSAVSSSCHVSSSCFVFSSCSTGCPSLCLIISYLSFSCYDQNFSFLLISDDWYNIFLSFQRHLDFLLRRQLFLILSYIVLSLLSHGRNFPNFFQTQW